MGKNNTVFFGLKNLAIAFIKGYDTQGRPEYETPIKILNAVGFSPSPENSDSEFRADDKLAWSDSQTTGYSGDLEVAKFEDVILQRH